ncbi:MAG: aminomethyl-transferring glycine dehydrogenase subunit GcvPB, partial [Thiomargarita sp.]|nr:aminomethyl-transferring glycine dehydrogenase subunit GcvPB [Thiomargarita sp.]
YHWMTESPDSIGRLMAYPGNIGILLRAYVYMRLLGRDGMHRVADFATLNANYVQTCLEKSGFELAFPNRRASHEFIITLKRLAKQHGIKAMDLAKGLLDKGCHAPTTYFPQLVPECLLIEPTETEDKETLDHFITAMNEVQKETADTLKNAPYHLPVRRLNELKAAKDLNIVWKNT